ncbi:response regulator [Haloarchaeobius sp. FL176]|uniref:response regulator n=1 Tax=Haloarchaeobius sp. FL176 TaxID=2967129 RepID=UPI002149524D|nr:response regulator [Haloarchaeobius sp. FL176]
MQHGSDAAEKPRALVVDDEKQVADAYALRLEGVCDVDTAYSGGEALSAVEERDMDVVLLDRHMPGMSGDEVLSELDERDYYGRVIMVTAIDPSFDVLEMPFDDYLCKPIEREGVRAAVRQQCSVLGYETLGEYFSVESKRAVLEAELPPAELEDNERYQGLGERATTLERRARRVLEDPDPLFDRFETVEREGR